MSDLTSALVGASKGFAEPIAQAYASGNRAFTVELRRPGAPGTFNRDSGAFEPRQSTVFYTGPARIRPSMSQTRTVGDEDVPFNQAVVTIDYLTDAAEGGNSEHPTWTPRKDDLVVVTDDAQAAEWHLANRVFEVTGVAVGGHIGTGWELEVLGAAPSREGATSE